MKVFVYFNLHKRVWSIQCREGENYGKVIAHRRVLVLHDCKMKVSEAGRQRVLRERKKNVHAGIVGEWIDTEIINQLEPEKVDITYNPYKHQTFVQRGNERPIHDSKEVWMSLNYNTFRGTLPVVKAAV